VDTFTHALSALVIFSPHAADSLLPFAILGAIIPDIDITFRVISRRNPRLYLFTHGGFTHSIAGGLAVSLLAFLVAWGLALTGRIPWMEPGPFVPLALVVMLAGTLLHVLEDYLAYPGIPVLYPFTDRKYTAGIFPGPSLVLFGVSLVFVTWAALGAVGASALGAYAVIFFGFIGASAAVKGYMAVTYPGQTIPTFNPLRWLLVDGDGDRLRISEHHLLRGTTATLTVDRFRGITPAEAAAYDDLPEVRAHRYFSYLSVAERNGDSVTFSDPLRDRGIIPYPPYARSVTVASHPAVG
jgi:inner membrane protein